jgi:hypothetical protein
MTAELDRLELLLKLAGAAIASFGTLIVGDIGTLLITITTLQNKIDEMTQRLDAVERRIESYFYSSRSSRWRLLFSFETRARVMGWHRLAPQASREPRHKPHITKKLQHCKITAAVELRADGKSAGQAARPAR